MYLILFHVTYICMLICYWRLEHFFSFQLFKGKFHHCVGLDDDDLDKVTTRQDCIVLGGKWINKKYNFDNLFQVSLLFKILTN